MEQLGRKVLCFSVYFSKKKRKETMKNITKQQSFDDNITTWGWFKNKKKKNCFSIKHVTKIDKMINKSNKKNRKRNCKRKPP